MRRSRPHTTRSSRYHWRATACVRRALLDRDDDALATYERMLARERERTAALPPEDGTRAIKPARLLVELGRIVAARRAINEAQRRADLATVPDAGIQAEIADLRVRNVLR